MFSVIDDLKTNFSLDQIIILAHFYQLSDDLSIHDLLTAIAQENLHRHTQSHSAKMLTAEEAELLKLRSYGSQPFIERFVNYYNDDFKTTWKRCFELENAKIHRDPKVCDTIQDPIEKEECIKEMKNPCDWDEWAKQHSEEKDGKTVLTKEAKKDLDQSLNIALKGESLTGVKTLLKLGANPNFAIRDAVKMNNVDMVKILLKYGANIHFSDVINTAVKNGYYEIVRVLLEHGADPNVAINIAVSKGDFKMTRLIIEHAKPHKRLKSLKHKALMMAALTGHLKMVKFLIRHGAAINETRGKWGDIERYTPLIAAAIGGHVEIVKLLLEKGADIHEREDGALRDAVREGKIEIVKLLLENGADINGGDGLPPKNTSLEKAAAAGFIEIVELLLENGANVHANQDNALRIALKKGREYGSPNEYYDIANLLIKYGASENNL